MRNEVVGLKNKAYRVVAVSVTVAVGVFLGRAAVDHKVAVCVLIQTADDVQQRCFAAAGVTEHGNKLGFSELKVNALERMHSLVADSIVLGYAF